MSHYEKQREEAEREQKLEEAMKAKEQFLNNLNTESSIDSVLSERGDRYGNFANQAALSQTLKNTIMQHYFQTHGGNEAQPLPAYMVEAIAMICHKLARIANGDPNYSDSWTDIQGYSELVVRELEKQK